MERGFNAGALWRRRAVGVPRRTRGASPSRHGSWLQAGGGRRGCGVGMSPADGRTPPNGTIPPSAGERDRLLLRGIAR
ncbi:MAG: hypothetical protein ACYCUM_14410, partial [Solirubrobacteraceae bacterium]